MLHDQDLIGQFIQYMTSQDRGHLVKFWLDSENFTEASLSRIRVHSIHSVIESDSTSTTNNTSIGSNSSCMVTESKLSVPDNNSNTTSIHKSSHRSQDKTDLQERKFTDYLFRRLFSGFVKIMSSEVCSVNGRIILFDVPFPFYNNKNKLLLIIGIS